MERIAFRSIYTYENYFTKIDIPADGSSLPAYYENNAGKTDQPLIPPLYQLRIECLASYKGLMLR